ncbi:hypothetical protein Asp14428_49600 [Actinoplanes sp. NBRC 14428]|nr:hypothetical protein Asp14428_49600 [Actinoplanes sp. NBRC 14428]
MEVLLVLTVGLIVNRYQAFYPSWRDLAGARAEAVAAVPPSLAPAAGPPGDDVVLPPGYAARAGVTFPVIVVLCGPAELAGVRELARRVPDVVTVALAPRTADDVTGMMAGLPRTVRVAEAIALVTDASHRGLADRLHDTLPAVATVTAAGPRGWETALGEAADRLPSPLAHPLRS